MSERVTIVSVRPKILVNWTSVATRVFQHPWEQHDSIMPRSKEDDAARKREERSARSADDAAARSADDAARKREDLLLRMALFNHSIRLESQGQSLGQCLICNWLCIGLTDSVLSSGPIVLTVPQKLIPGRSRRKSSSATVSNLHQLGSSRSVC